MAADVEGIRVALMSMVAALDDEISLQDTAGSHDANLLASLALQLRAASVSASTIGAYRSLVAL